MGNMRELILLLLAGGWGDGGAGAGAGGCRRARPLVEHARKTETTAAGGAQGDGATAAPVQELSLVAVGVHVRLWNMRASDLH